MNEPELEARLEDVHERMPALFRMIRQRVSAEQLASERPSAGSPSTFRFTGQVT